MSSIKGFCLAITQLFMPDFLGFHVALAECSTSPRMNEEFEARGYEDWESVTDGGTISIAPGYKGQGIIIARANSGGDQYTHLERELPSSWAGKTIRIDAMVKYSNIKAGNRFHHAGHIDYEAFTDTGPVYPDWGRFTGTQVDWGQWSAKWQIPANAARTIFRIGLQGTSGTIYFDDLKIYLCEPA